MIFISIMSLCSPMGIWPRDQRISSKHSNSFCCSCFFFLSDKIEPKVWKELLVFATKMGVAITCKDQLQLGRTWETIK